MDEVQRHSRRPNLQIQYTIDCEHQRRRDEMQRSYHADQNELQQHCQYSQHFRRLDHARSSSSNNWCCCSIFSSNSFFSSRQFVHCLDSDSLLARKRLFSAQRDWFSAGHNSNLKLMSPALVDSEASWIIFRNRSSVGTHVVILAS